MAIQFLNTVQVDTDVLYVDTSSDRVGIGTTSPNAKLEITTLRESGIRLSSSDITAFPNELLSGIEFYSPDTTAPGVKASIQVKYNDSNANSYMTFSTGTNSERMRIDSNGNVGIGTTSPERLLSLYSNNTETTPRLLIEQDGTGDAVMAFSLVGGQGWSMGIDNSGGDSFMIHNSAGGVDSSSQFTIKDDGNVGIGTTSPNSKFQVKVGTNQNIGFNSHSSVARISSYNDAFSASTPLKINGSDLRFDISSVEKMRVTSAGNVGIGTTNPSAPLDVFGVRAGRNWAINNRAVIRLDSNGTSVPSDILFGHTAAANQTSWTGAYWSLSSRGSSASNKFYFYRASGNPTGASEQVLMTFDPDLKVGIGTTSPDHKLDVEGNIGLNEYLYKNGDNNHYLRFTGNKTEIQAGSTVDFRLGTNSAPQGGDFQFASDSGNDFTISYTRTGNAVFKQIFSGQAMHWQNNTSKTVFYANNAGNVGIGTTTPVETLTIPSGEGTMLGFKRFYSNTGTVPAGVGSSYALTATLNTEQGTTLTSKYQYKFYLTTTGTGTYNSSVYIVYRNSADNAWVSREVTRSGTSSNHPELAVSGNNALIYNDHPSAYGVSYRVETSYTGQAKTSPEIFGSDYMWQRTQGVLSYTESNVGIGTSSPTHKLDVSGTFRATGASAIQGRLSVGTSSSSDIDMLRAGGNYITATNASGVLYFRTVNDIRMAITAGGNVGIGTINPTSKLHVQGTSFFFDQSIFDDKVGIGTTSPGSKLEVNVTDDGFNDIDVLRLKRTWASGSSNDRAHGILFNDSNSRLATIYADRTNSGSNYNSQLLFSVNSGTSGTSMITPMVINNLGRVGIGTTNPTANLHVYTSTNSSTIEVGRGAGRSSIKASADADGGYLALDSSGNGLILNHYSSDNVWLVTGGGNVGVGNSGPSQKLHITGNLRVTGAYYDSNNSPGTANQVLVSTVTGTDWVDGSGSSIIGGPYLPLTGGTLTGNLSGTTIGLSGGITANHFRTNSGNTDYNLFTRNSTGNTIFVQAAQSNANQPIAKFSYGSATVNAGTAVLQVSKDNSHFVNCNVGIGTTNPLYKIHSSNSGSRNDLQFTLDSFGTGSTDGAQLGIQAGGAYIWNFENNDLYFATNNSRVLTIKPSGNVGIGTTSPNYKLSVSGGIEAGGVVTYSKVAGSLDTTGYAIAGLGTAFNGASAGFTFTAYGGTGKYQKVVYSCYGSGTTWYVKKVIDEGTNTFDIVASASSAATITFTFKTRSGSQGYSPRVVIEATGHSIISTYA